MAEFTYNEKKYSIWNTRDVIVDRDDSPNSIRIARIKIVRDPWGNVFSCEPYSETAHELLKVFTSIDIEKYEYVHWLCVDIVNNWAAKTR